MKMYQIKVKNTTNTKYKKMWHIGNEQSALREGMKFAKEVEKKEKVVWSLDDIRRI